MAERDNDSESDDNLSLGAGCLAAGVSGISGLYLATPLDQWTSSSSTASTCAGGISSAVDNESVVGGTSASSPVFAGIVAVLNQYLGSAGLGNINPMLYSLAATPANGAFTNITSGDMMFTAR